MMNSFLASPDFLSSSKSASLQLNGSTKDQSVRPWLGVEVINITPKIAKILHDGADPRKFLVSYVFPGSPAGKARRKKCNYV